MTPEEQEELLVLGRTVDEVLAAAGDEVTPEEAWEALAELGMTAVGLPEELGGSGGDVVQAAAVLRAVAYRCAPAPVAESAWGGSWLLARAGLPVPECPAVALWVGADVEVASSGGTTRIRGTVRAVAGARCADLLVVAVPNEAGAALVRLTTDNVTLVPGADLAGLPLDDVCLDVEVLDAELVAVPVTRDDFDLRVAVARLVQITGAAARAADLVLDHVRTREQFGRPLARFQVVQGRAATIASSTRLLDAAADLAVESIASIDRPDGDEADLRAARLRAVLAVATAYDAVGEVAAHSHQLLGAMGFTTEHPLYRSTTRMWSWREEAGGQRRWLAQAAEALLADQGRDAWAQLADR
ncbi:acyl-CoA dehydrogenase family protein [Nocardia sp. NPDC004278]